MVSTKQKHLNKIKANIIHIITFRIKTNSLYKNENIF